MLQLGNQPLSPLPPATPSLVQILPPPLLCIRPSLSPRALLPRSNCRRSHSLCFSHRERERVRVRGDGLLAEALLRHHEHGECSAVVHGAQIACGWYSLGDLIVRLICL